MARTSTRVHSHLMRRSPLVSILAPLLGAVLAAQDAPRRPNIVVILSDDMGWSDIGCMGSEIATPNLDRLAADGLRFTQFYNTGRCCPTRASLLTGLYPHQAGVGHMTGRDRGLPGYAGELNRECVTIAEVLHGAGYRTYACGKWHVSLNTGPGGARHDWPLQRGFDRYYGTLTGAGNYFDPSTLCRDNTPISCFDDDAYRPEHYYYTDAISDNAVAFLREHAERTPERPFFAYVAFTAAHWPMQAPDDEIAKHRGRYADGYEMARTRRVTRLRKLGLIDRDWDAVPTVGAWEQVEDRAWEERCMEVYAAMVSRMDAGVGRIVAELERQGRLDDTLILFMQDNGGCAETIGRSDEKSWHLTDLKPMAASDLQRRATPPMQTRDGHPVLGGRDVMPGAGDTYIAYGQAWANVSNTPFREYKHWVHEGGIATPLIVHWPAAISAERRGTLAHDPAHLIDVMATCVDVSHAVYPRTVNDIAIQPPEGVSLARVLRGEELQRAGSLFWEHEGNRAVRAGRWKLVAKGPRGRWELYDMEHDRTELHDLAAAEPERAADLAARWELWAERARVKPWPWTRKVSTARRFDLAADADLRDGDAPDLAGRPFRVTATIAMPGTGVVVAYGGSSHGFALYVDAQARPHLALRHDGHLSTFDSPAALPDGPCRLVVELGTDGALTLRIDDQVVLETKSEGPLTDTPADGCQVGTDADGLVGQYGKDARFSGRIQRVLLELDI